jgi:hypothetical protein
MRLIDYNFLFESNLLNDIENEYDSSCSKIIKLPSNKFYEKGARMFEYFHVIGSDRNVTREIVFVLDYLVARGSVVG